MALALITATILSSCGYFSNKMNDVMSEGGKQFDKQTDSLKTEIMQLRAASMSDSVFGAKFDTLCSSGFKLADLSKRLANNTNDTVAMKKQLKHFTNYVVKNFDYTEDITNLMPMVSMGMALEGADMPLGINGSKEIWRASSRQAIMQIILICHKQNKPKPAV